MSSTTRLVCVSLLAVLATALPSLAGGFNNPDFEEVSPYDPTSYLWGWSRYEKMAADLVTSEGSGGNHWGHVYSEGSWSYQTWGTPGWKYIPGEAWLQQSSVFIPADATHITFDTMGAEVDSTGEGLAHAIVTHERWSPTAEDLTVIPASATWTTVSVPIPEQWRGRRAPVWFRAYDASSQFVADPVGDTPPAVINSIDFHVDNVTVNGAQQLQEAQWTAAGGGAYGEAGNWDTPAAPINTPAVAYDVEIEHVAGGPVVVSSDVSVQTFRCSNASLQLEAGVTVEARDEASFYGADVELGPGSSIHCTNGRENLYFSGGSLTSGPGNGQVARFDVSLDYGYSPGLKFQGVSGTEPCVVDLTDAIVSAGVHGSTVSVGDNATVVFRRSAACTQRVGVWGHVELQGVTSVATFEPGTGIYGSSVRAYDGQLNLNGAELGSPEEGASSLHVSSDATATIRGATSIYSEVGVSIDVYGVGGTAHLCDADVSVNRGTCVSDGLLKLENSTLTDEGILTVGDTGSISADADSTIVCGGMDNRLTVAEQFDLDEATLAFRPPADGIWGSWVRMRLGANGFDRGESLTGYVDNFAIGELVVLEDTLNLYHAEEGHAQYVHDLRIEPGATLDLNGIPLYYSGSFTNLGSVVGGEPVYVPEPGSLVLLACGTLAALRRRRR